MFCVEKILYSAHWVCWILAHGDSLGSLYETDFQSGLFYSVYGINDILFAVFFAYAFLRASKESEIKAVT